VKILRKSVNMW